MSDLPRVQSIAPSSVAAVNGADTLAEAVRGAARDGRALVDYGARHGGLGHAPPRGFTLVDASAMAGVLNHYVPDMTVRVRAATTLRDVRDALAAENQWLPIDGDEDDAMTVGEMIAHNVYGPLRLSFGSMRDLLLGLKFIDASGDLIAVGGRTVKNVAGYDVTKLMVGGLNTLGLITEATLRTWARPRQVTRMTVHDPDMRRLDACMTDLLTDDATPVYLDYHCDRSGPALHVAYAGTALSCDTQIAAMHRWLARSSVGAGDAAVREGVLDDDDSARRGRRRWRADVAALVKLIVPPASTGEAIDKLRADAIACLAIDALPAQGVIWCGGDWPVDHARRVDHALATLVEAPSMRIWLRRPEHDPAIEPFAPNPPDEPLLRRIIKAMNPQQTLNPGRFIR